MPELTTTRTCAWCKEPIPATHRSDALCCSVRCRQARHRFTSSIGTGTSGNQPLQLAYADPPYPGLSKRYYGQHPDYDGEVDHTALIHQLSRYDGWALSTSARALPAVLASCPPGVRVAAWHRGERPTTSAGPLNAWEPVIYYGGRATRTPHPSQTAGTDAYAPEPVTPGDRYASTVDARRVDSLVHHARPRLTDPDRVVGAKPAAFIRWIFDLLGAQQ